MVVHHPRPLGGAGVARGGPGALHPLPPRRASRSCGGCSSPRRLRGERARGGVRLDPGAAVRLAAGRRHRPDRGAAGRREDRPTTRRSTPPPSRRCGSSRSRCRCRSTRRCPRPSSSRRAPALARAKAVGEEYEGVEVATATVRARRAGQAIVDEAKRRGVQAVVLGAEEPSKIRGGALLGGRGGPLDDFVGEATKYVIAKAPCQIILTAPPADAHPRSPRAPRGRSHGRRSDAARRWRATSHAGRLTAPMTTALRKSGPMPLILIVGAGRVGSSVARSMLAAGNEVSILDEDPLSHERLDSGHGHHLGGLRRALHRRPRPWRSTRSRGRHRRGRRLHRLDRRRQHEPHHRPDRRQAVRRAQGHRARDGPARAEWYEEQGLHTICPTRYAIEMFERALEVEP